MAQVGQVSHKFLHLKAFKWQNGDLGDISGSSYPSCS